MGILNALKQKGVTMAVASRTPTPDIANCFLNKLGIPSFFADMVSMKLGVVLNLMPCLC